MITTFWGCGLTASLNFMLRIALISEECSNDGEDNPSRLKAKDTPFVKDWVKKKGCTSFVLYLNVFKNHFHYLWHVGLLSRYLINHVYIKSFQGIIKLPKSFPGVGVFEHLE